MWSWPRMRIPRAEVIAAWGLSLQGMIGSFRYYPNRTVVSALVGRTVATKAFATNNAVSVGGWVAGALSTLRIGQWLTIGTQLLRITEAAAVADENGRVTVTFEPALRADVAAGVAVEFVRPFGVFRLASTDSPAYTLDPDRAADFGSIEAREVV